MPNRKKHIKTIAIGFLNLIAVFSMAQNPIPFFNTNQTAGCPPLAIQFTNTSSNASSYYWDFGNGNTSVLANPSNVYSNAGTYSVKLVAFAANGQKDSVLSSNLITVSAGSVADFYAVNASSCFDGNIFSFINTSINSDNFLWDFGDGYTSSIQNPFHTYTSQGNYTIKLIAYNSYGCSNIKTLTNYIHVISNPVTEFTVNTTVGCNLNQVFNFSSTTPSVTAWLWNFGDGNTSTLPNPNHIYNAVGTYTVSLLATNANGCANSLTLPDYISSYAPQIPVFTSSTTNGCLPVAVTFTNLSANAIGWEWNFGDGNTSTDETPAHTYQNSGNYSIGLTITADNNCTYSTTVNNFISITNNPVSNFSLSNTSNCAPLNIQFVNQSTNATSWLWEFGDGNTATLQNPIHTYITNNSYTITLHAYNASGCEAVSQHLNTVLVNQPVAAFSANFTPGCAPLPTNFTNISTNAVQWLWNFGDGTSSSLKNPSHIYNLPGDYDVSLVAVNAQGCRDTLTLNSYIHVINSVGNFVTPPTITGCAPFKTTFSSTTPEAVSWLWNFGDGNTSTLQNPAHTYLTSGFYTVSLTIQLNGGCTQYYPDFRIFNIKGGQAEFTFLPQAECAPFVVNFTGTLPGNSSTCFWNFGDGITSTLQNPNHTYSTSGFYTVEYATTSSEGCINKTIETNGLHFISCPSGGTNSGGSQGGSGEGNEVGGNPGNSTNSALPPLIVCVPFTVHFNNTLVGTVAWSWDFGDGATSTMQNPFHEYTMGGNYDVKLIALNSSGQNDTVIYPDYIHASGINTDFSFTENSDCINSTLTFTDMSQNAVQWHWDFGDGSTSTLQNPVKTIANTLNNYAITLTASNSFGCSASAEKNILRTTENAAIWANNYLVCTNQPVSFSCASSNFAAYLWDFGDGTSSTLQNPTHSYQAGGAFQVVLTLTDNNGCTRNSSSANLLMVKNPVAHFTYALANGCGSQVVNFTNLSTGTSAPLSVHSKWNFGDGTPEQWAENPVHIYSNSGVYQVTLSVNNDNNCFNSTTKTIVVQPILSNFSYTQNTTCFPISVAYSDSSSSNTVSWLWDFGDGTTSVLQNPVHLFTIAPSADVTLTITGVNGCQATTTQANVTTLNADFAISVVGGCAPLAVDFIDFSLNANQWLWTFGDGTSSTAQNPSHVYLNNGLYTVTLITKSIGGCSDTLIFNSINVNFPTANFSSTNPTNCSPVLVSFTDSSIDAVSWLWDFGDGSSSVNQNPGHIYNISGLYTVKLIVVNAFGCSDTLIRFNYIDVPGPIANFTVSANLFCLNSATQFSDFSTNAMSWNWNFGDGNTSILQTPSNTYQNSGEYTVSLIVNDSNGCTSNFILPNPIVINPLPKAAFIVSDTVSCQPFPVSFQNYSQNAVSYLWNFGDGNNSTLQDPSNTYLNFGIYSVALIAINQFGCSDTSFFNSIVANKTPGVNFSSNIAGGCSPLSIAFTDSSTNIQNADYFWNFSNGSTSTIQSPATIFTNPGFYSVSLIITNNTGCSDTLINNSTIEVYDFNPPARSMIKSVTVSSNNSNQVTWNQSTATDFSYYEIFRKNNSTGNYSSIKTINNSSVCTFLDDNDLNTLSNSYCYKVQTVDVCGYSLPLDSLKENCTINATVSGINDDIQVNWTPYIGAVVESYSIYRMEPGSDIPVLIAVVPPSVLSAIDTTLPCPSYYSYRIKANNLNGISVFSFSDTSIAKPVYNELALQKVDVVRSSVINNNEVLTEWKAPLIAPEKVTGYNIYRSTDNLTFSFLTYVLPTAHEYFDYDVDVNTQNYYYKIVSANSCNMEGIESNKSSSILLKAELIDGLTSLKWTSYEGWDVGVGYYIVEKMDENGVWKTIKTVEGNILNCEDGN